MQTYLSLMKNLVLLLFTLYNSTDNLCAHKWDKFLIPVSVHSALVFSFEKIKRGKQNSV